MKYVPRLPASVVALPLLAAPLMVVPVTVAPAQAAPAQAAPPTCAGEKATIVGNAKNNVLRGTAKRDVIVGGEGNDVIRGLGGNDLICGGGGADRIYGGPGDDRLYGELDAYWTDAYGRALKAGDTLSGGPGDDLLDPGIDTRATTKDAPVRPDAINFASAPAPVAVDLRANPVLVAAEGSDTLVTGGPLEFIGTAHADTILGTDHDDILRGRGGDDTLAGNGGDDTIHGDVGSEVGNDAMSGGSGDDALVGTLGSDSFVGNGGEDHLSSTSILPQAFRGGSGADTVVFPLPEISGMVARGHKGQDRLRLLAHPNPTLKPIVRVDQKSGKMSIRSLSPTTVTGQISGFSEIHLPDRARSIYKGTNSSEIVRAHPDARALIYGRGGADVMIGSRWADRLDGGKGFDIARGKGGNDTCKRVERRSSC